MPSGERMNAMCTVARWPVDDHALVDEAAGTTSRCHTAYAMWPKLRPPGYGCGSRL